jgi:hypothetical protein
LSGLVGDVPAFFWSFCAEAALACAEEPVSAIFDVPKAVAEGAGKIEGVCGGRGCLGARGDSGIVLEFLNPEFSFVM